MTGTAQPLITSLLALLALVLAISGCGGVMGALCARRDARRASGEAREATTRAALAESALATIRHNRSAATSKGNRTRAAARAAAVHAATDELRSAIAHRKAPPQSAFSFDGNEAAPEQPKAQQW